MGLGSYYLIPRICSDCQTKKFILKNTTICKDCLRAKIREAIRKSNYTEEDLNRDLEDYKKHVVEKLEKYFNELDSKNDLED